MAYPPSKGQPQRKPDEEEQPRQTPGDSYPLQQPIQPQRQTPIGPASNQAPAQPNGIVEQRSGSKPAPAASGSPPSGGAAAAKARDSVAPAAYAPISAPVRVQSYQPPPPPRASQQAGYRPQPTDFTNFSRRFSANADVSHRSANKLAGGAEGAEGAADKALADAQAKFKTDVAAGTVDDPFAPSGVGQTPGAWGEKQPSSIVAPDSAKGGASAVPAANPAAPAGAPSDGAPATGPTADNPSGDPTIAAMLAKAGQTYLGPGGLDSADAADKANLAQEQLDALGSAGGVQALVNEGGPSGSRGADALSGALVHQAGRGQFDTLRAKFNPNKNLADAETKAMGEADAARKTSETNAAGWGDAASRQSAFDAKTAAAKSAEDSANMSAEEKAKGAKREADANRVPPGEYSQFRGEDTPQNRVDYMMGGVDPTDGVALRQRREEIQKYMQAMTLTTQNSVDQTFNDFNSTMSPVNWVTDAAGVPDFVQNGGQEYLGQKGAGAASGSTKGTPIPWNKVGPDGFFVFRSMTPQDWDVLNHKPPNGPNGQIAWIRTKMDMLRRTKNAAPPIKGG